MNSSRFRNIFVYVLIGIAILAIFVGLRNNSPTTSELKISELANKIKNGTSRANVGDGVAIKSQAPTAPPMKLVIPSRVSIVLLSSNSRR